MQSDRPYLQVEQEHPGAESSQPREVEFAGRLLERHIARAFILILRRPYAVIAVRCHLTEQRSLRKRSIAFPVFPVR